MIQVGDEAPDFTLRDQNNEEVTLSAFRGEKAVLVDSIAPLADDGYIWLLTPKRGRDGYVEPSDISEAASVAGLSQTSIATVGPDWAGARLVGRKSSGGKR